MSQLTIKPADKAAHDFLALGALVTRLDPGIVPFAEADKYDLHVSGGEYNVAANLSICFGQRAAVASAIVDYPIGKRIEKAVRGAGVTPYYARFAHDGVRGPNMATVWSDRGGGVRAPVVFYNRANEAAGYLKAGSFDWDAIFGKGVRWFHSGGIFSALSESTPELVVQAMKAARKAGAVVSFDLNYRAKLWAVAAAASGKDPSKVDRSAAYMARFAAKNIVANGFAKKCLVSVAYAIGRAEPLMVEAINEKGESLAGLVSKKFDFRPKAIIERLDLRRPIYFQTAAYGHFGKPNLPWERIERI